MQCIRKQVIKRGCGRFRIDVDTTGGDETYTTLKNSIPFTRVFCKGLIVNGFSRVRLVFPDVGASALAMRDWAGDDAHAHVCLRVLACTFADVCFPHVGAFGLGMREWACEDGHAAPMLTYADVC